MKNNFVLILLCSSITTLGQFNYEKSWGTYFCGNSSGAFKIKHDKFGNLYCIGAATNLNNVEDPSYYQEFSTPAASQPTFNNNSWMITKFSVNGELLWSSYFGLDIPLVPQFDGVNDIDFDSDNNVYLIGNIDGYQGQGIISEPADLNIYDLYRKGFIAKFSADGERLWSKWVPFYPARFRINNSNSLLISGFTSITDFATDGVFQPVYYNNNADRNAVIVSYDPNGIKQWATYNGTGSGGEIILDDEKNIFVTGTVLKADDLYASPGCLQSQSNYNIPPGQVSSFISKFSSNGQRIWSTYFGLSNEISNITIINGIYIRNKSLYFTGTTNVNTSIATAGTYQTTPFVPFIYVNVNSGSNSQDGFIEKFDTDGNRIWGTYFGGESADNPQSIHINDQSLFVSGTSYSHTNIATPDGFQPMHSETAVSSGFIANFNLDGTQQNWGTYYGGQGECTSLSLDLAPDNTIFIAGTTQSDDGIATPGAIQPFRNTGSSPTPAAVSNMFIARFDDLPLSTDSFETNDLQLFPNPNNGRFTLKGSLGAYDNDVSISFYDIQGRLIHFEKIVSELNLSHEISIGNKVSKGVYFARLQSGKKAIKVFKFIVE